MSKEVIDQAIAALKAAKRGNLDHAWADEVITALEELLEQEPVAWTVAGQVRDWSKDFSAYQTKHYVRPVYTSPLAQRKPLTDEEITKAFNEAMAKRPKDASNAETNRLFARAIEAAHNVKEHP